MRDWRRRGRSAGFRMPDRPRNRRRGRRRSRNAAGPRPTGPTCRWPGRLVAADVPDCHRVRFPASSPHLIHWRKCSSVLNATRAVRRTEQPSLRKCGRRRPTLPRSGPRSTIGAERLSFRVRDGTGRFPLAMVAETLWRYGPHHLERDGDRTSGTAQWTRHGANPAKIVLWQVLGLLVPVSCTCYHASTSGLSTRWSSRGPYSIKDGRSHLEASFPLRCFQRLSLPNVANQQCSWRNNWHTRGSSVPVLSY